MGTQPRQSLVGTKNEAGRGLGGCPAGQLAEPSSRTSVCMTAKSPTRPTASDVDVNPDAGVARTGLTPAQIHPATVTLPISHLNRVRISSSLRAMFARRPHCGVGTEPHKRRWIVLGRTRGLPHFAVDCRAVHARLQSRDSSIWPTTWQPTSAWTL